MATLDMMELDDLKALNDKLLETAAEPTNSKEDRVFLEACASRVFKEILVDEPDYGRHIGAPGKGGFGFRTDTPCGD